MRDIVTRCRFLMLLSLGMVPMLAQAAPQARQQIREVMLDGNSRVHTVEVVGWPNVTTAIQFNDSFEAVNVLCGQCTEVAPGEASNHVAEEKRNWIIEKRVPEHSIHVRPAIRPGVDKEGQEVPFTAFTTNVYVALNGGHAVNIELKILHPSMMPAGMPLTADAVVSLRLPTQDTMSGQLATLQKRLNAKHAENVKEAAHQLMRERLSGRVKCKDIKWRRPYRNDRAIVQLNQLCMSAGKSKTFWVTFELENRSDVEFYIEGATLEPESQASTLPDPTTLTFDKDMLAFGETAQGMAIATLGETSTIPSSWRLVVSPASSGRGEIKVEHLTF